MKRTWHLYLLYWQSFYLTLISMHKSTKKFGLTGFHAPILPRDAIDKSSTEDTMSAKSISNGYNVLDLNTHVNPIDNIEIFSQIRIRNSFGSFFGSGTEINVRQLRAGCYK